MNFNTYGAYYGEFHKCTISLVRQNVVVFTFGSSAFETWLVARMYPPDSVRVDSDKALLLALKAFFKSDVPASVVCNDKYLWTVCLGKDRVVYPADRESNRDNTFRYYATPYFVTDPEVVGRYLQGTIRPAYENVFFYKNAVLFLDASDLPYPGGSYFDACEPTPYHRICFLSDEPVDRVLDLAAEWQSRRGVVTVAYMTREVKAVPKFVDFRPVADAHVSEAAALSVGVVRKTLSGKKAEHLVQDVLNSYYGDLARRSGCAVDGCVGLLIEWPFLLTFEGARTNESGREGTKKFVALSVNGARPERVLHVTRPYDRYVESANVPSTLWTPVSFVPSTLLTDPGVRKVAVDGTVIGVVYRETFFCLGRPLLEGKPNKRAVLNGNYLLSTASFDLREDENVRVLERFGRSERHSMCRVSLKGLSVSVDAWCLTESSGTDPVPKSIRLPALVREWTEFFEEVSEDAFDVDVGVVRLALMLSKHGVCFRLNAVDSPQEAIRLYDNEIHFYLNEKVVQFVNDVRLMKDEKLDESRCCVS